MALMTMIARVVDGLPLVGTMAEDEQVSKLSKTEKERREFSYNGLTFTYSPEKVFWNIKTRPKCYSVNLDHNLHQDVPLKLALTCSSKLHTFFPCYFNRLIMIHSFQLVT